MFRLNKRAFNILAKEVEQAAKKDAIAGEVSQEIAITKLKKLRSQPGKPLTEGELQELFIEIFPNFSDREAWAALNRAIKKAVKVNRSSSKLWLLPKAGVALAVLAGGIWVINLPYPMIRRPVARTAPILLLPSYLSMDHNYRQAIAKVEQADQLVNNATSLADILLGEEKVIQAQQHLDKLPVWFLGYEPQMYRTMFSFGWYFTFDEFKAARTSIGRMEAKIFQEKNGMKQLEGAEAVIKQAKQAYQQATDEASKRNAIASWQNGIDTLTQIPTATLASNMANTKLSAYQRDFQAVSGLIAGNDRTNTMIAVAQKFSGEAISSCANAPHSVDRWQQCANLWEQAIARLETVPLEDPGYLKAQSLLANYQTNWGEIQIRQQAEANSVKAFEKAQSQIVSLPKQVDSSNRDRVISQIQQIVIQLEKVQAGTTVYQKASELMTFAEKKLQEIES